MLLLEETSNVFDGWSGVDISFAAVRVFRKGCVVFTWQLLTTMGY